jgi:fucose permease
MALSSIMSKQNKYPGSILISHLRKAFRLNTLRFLLVDSSVFIISFLISVPVVMIMKRSNYKLITNE